MPPAAWRVPLGTMTGWETRAATAVLVASALGVLVTRRLLPRAPVDATSPAPALCVEEPPPTVAATPSFPRARTQIAVPEQNPLEIYPPRGSSRPSPLTLALHGKDMDPLDMCERWSAEGRERSWLLCPAGNTPGAETFDWGGTSDERLDALDAQLEAVDAVYGSLVDHAAGDVLVGFSRGSFLARDLAYARPGRFTGMVLMGAAVKLDADRLRAAGVRRVVLAAGDKDEARPSMEHTAARLSANRIDARFISLGPFYHVLPEKLGPVMRDALAWVRADG
jgi:predicted esterase